MANTAVVTSAEWIEGAAPYQTTPGAGLNAKQQMALKLHAMAIELAAVGGTDYTADFESMIDASEALGHWMNCDQVKAAEVLIHYTNAANAGGSVPAATGDKLEAAKKLIEYDFDRLEKAYLFLLGSLGYHSSF